MNRVGLAATIYIDGDGSTAPRNSTHDCRETYLNARGDADISEMVEHPPVTAEGPRDRKIDSRKPLVCNRTCAGDRRVGGIKSLDECTRRLRRLARRLIRLQRPQESVDALVASERVRRLDDAGNRR